MKYIGITELVIMREGRIREKVEKKNDITPLVSWFTSQGGGNWHDLINRDKLLPLWKNFFGGCILTNTANSDGVAHSCISSDSIVTACSDSSTAYSGAYAPRGAMKASSGPITGGVKLVFEWNGNQGNGDIASVSLCRPQNGAVEIDYAGQSAPESTSNNVNEWLSDEINFSSWDETMKNILTSIQIIDYDHELAYAITYVSGTSITVKAYPINTYRNHLDGGACKVRDTTPVKEVEFTSGIGALNMATSTIAWTGDMIHVIVIDGRNSSTLTDYQIDIIDWTMTKVTRSYSGAGVQFEYLYDPYSGSDNVLRKDQILVDETNGYYYVLGRATGDSNYNSILRLPMDGTIAGVKKYPSTIVGGVHSNGPGVWLGNGDFLKFSNESQGASKYQVMFFHNEHVYETVTDMEIQNLHGINGTNHGSFICISQNTIRLMALYPFVTTVNNLTSRVTKKVGDVMTLTYTILEKEEE